MTADARSELIEILYQVHSYSSGAYYEFFWYHWPRDGFLPWEDYEPIVFAYNHRGELCFVLVRRAWKLIIHNPDDIAWPPQIIFEGSNHHQFFKMRDDSGGKFDCDRLPKLSKISVSNSDLGCVSTCLGLIDNWIIRDIYKRVEAALAELCLPDG